MPMVLRPRKSKNNPGKEEDDPDSSSEEGQESAPKLKWKSSRLRARTSTKYEEDGDDSDSDSGQNNVGLEKRSDEATGDEAEMHIQSCSILLNRLESDRDEMNRRSGIPKPTSRIPTFHKKTAVTTTTSATEASKSKPAAAAVEVKERFLPAPSVRFSSDVTETTSYTITATKTHSESFLTASPRPALRRDQGANQQDHSRTQTGSEEEEEEGGERGVYVREEREEREERGDGEREKQKAESEGITEEQPPWENNTLETNTKQFQCVASSTEPESQSEEEEEEEEEEEVPQVESLKPDKKEEEEEKSEEDPPETEALSQIKTVPLKTVPAPPVEAESAPAQNKHTTETKHTTDTTETRELPAENTKQSCSSCCSLLLRCLLPLLLLLVLGFSQHLWLYGLPRSVAQLSDQLHLHWLHGIVPESAPCSSQCRVSLVESLPEGLYPSAPAPRESIAQSWLRLLDRANHSADIAAFYVTLRSSEPQPPTDRLDLNLGYQVKAHRSIVTPSYIKLFSGNYTAVFDSGSALIYVYRDTYRIVTPVSDTYRIVTPVSDTYVSDVVSGYVSYRDACIGYVSYRDVCIGYVSYRDSVSDTYRIEALGNTQP
ncbi:hypothetical protein WMY93_008752 [Mugilogobius chulae]|uniref:Uncharacterized protein n=1 Tax=Mugilogobius chulae TaxID=88201 RepID=A0AAW0PDF4_9GOBI